MLLFKEEKQHCSFCQNNDQWVVFLLECHIFLTIIRKSKVVVSVLFKVFKTEWKDASFTHVLLKAC